MLLMLINNKADLIGQLAKGVGNTGELGFFHPADGMKAADIREIARQTRIESLVSVSTWLAAAAIVLTAVYLGYRALTLM